MSVKSRFWSKVRKTQTCWLWTASVNNEGYGKFGIGGDTWVLAHRVAWELRHGAIPAGLCVLHKCDTPSCVRAGHLFLGTLKDNTKDANAKARLRGAALKRGRALEVGEIRAIRRDVRNLKCVAAAYGVSISTVSNIRARRRWRHV